MHLTNVRRIYVCWVFPANSTIKCSLLVALLYLAQQTLLFVAVPFSFSVPAAINVTHLHRDEIDPSESWTCNCQAEAVLGSSVVQNLFQQPENTVCHQPDDQLQWEICGNHSRLQAFPIFFFQEKESSSPLTWPQGWGKAKSVFFPDSHLQQNDNPGAPRTALVCNEFGSDSLLVHSEIASELLTHPSKWISNWSQAHRSQQNGYNV